MTYFIGIDVGTQGARAVLIDAQGNIANSKEKAFALTEESRQEQDPAVWWEAVLSCLKGLIESARNNHLSVSLLKAISVTSTSGTVIPLDKAHHPLHPALMYSDDRSAEAGRHCREVAMQYHPSGYQGFNASSGLSKMVWFVTSYPEKTTRLAHWAHAADYIIGKLSGCWDITDETNVLKSGYDLQAGQWPDYLTQHLPLNRAWLPSVVPSGTPIGHLDPQVASLIGLLSKEGEKIVKNDEIIVTAGMTDGCASQVASGAVTPGSWNTTIGTTLVIKGVTSSPVNDPEDRLYNHRHPEGYWMPGGASNTGADWITTLFINDDLHALEVAAAGCIPTEQLVYPLLKQGERFPFMAPQAEGFGLESGKAGLENGKQAEFFAAGMEGVAFLEKMAFQLIKNLSSELIDRVYTAGGASNNSTWLKIRSAVLQLPVYKMKNVSGAVGAAILAASKTHYSCLTEATGHMTQIEATYEPDPVLAAVYMQRYRNFVEALARRGYIEASDYLD